MFKAVINGKIGYQSPQHCFGSKRETNIILMYWSCYAWSLQTLSDWSFNLIWFSYKYIWCSLAWVDLKLLKTTHPVYGLQLYSRFYIWVVGFLFLLDCCRWMERVPVPSLDYFKWMCSHDEWHGEEIDGVCADAGLRFYHRYEPDATVSQRCSVLPNSEKFHWDMPNTLALVRITENCCLLSFRWIFIILQHLKLHSVDKTNFN